MSKAQIAKLEAQLKALPPGSPAAKALTAALERAKATLRTKAPPSPPPAAVPAEPVAAPIPAPSPTLDNAVVEPPPLPAASNEAAEPPPAKSPTTAPPPIYQAVGLIHAELHRNEIGHYYLRWQDQDWFAYLLKVPPRTALALLGQKVYWRVYPQSWSVEQDFRVTGFVIIGQAKDPTDLVDGQFILAGCWQSFPYWKKEAKRPNYFTIYRNPTARFKTDRYKYAQHYAINHWDEPATTPKPRQRQPWHKISATLQADGSFDFMQVLDGPQPCPPRLRRPQPSSQKPEVSDDSRGDKALEESLT